MKLEFLDDISDNGRFPLADPTVLVRLYDFDSTQAKKFQQLIKSLVQERNDIDLSTHDFIENINCSLVLKISKIDEGITEIGKDKFACNLTVGIYSKMIALIEPFCESEIYGYQWLYDLNTPIDFLFSKDGSW